MKYDIAAIQQQVQSSIRDRHFVGNYEIKRKIGEGTFSSVFLAVHIMTGHEVVLKSAEKNQTNLASEIANMSLLYHPHIVRLYEYIVTTDKVWLVLEYCGGEELFSYLVRCKVIPPQQACQLFAQLAGAVAYAHQKNCAHRDIKLENVLLDENGTIKLGDFGFTRNYLPKSMLETVCGTESYMAPELLLRKKYYPEAADVWSLGVILYAMIYGRFPFDDDNAATTNRLVVGEDPPFPTIEGGDILVEITRNILNKDPRKRPTVAQILEQLGDSGKQQQILLLKLEAHPELSHIFTSKEERAVLKGMKVLNIDLHAVAFSVVNHKCDPLHGLWYTALDRQRLLKKQEGPGSADVVLGRRKSKASMKSARSFVGNTLTRSSQKSLSRPASLSRASITAQSLTSPSAADLQGPAVSGLDSSDHEAASQDQSRSSQIISNGSPESIKNNTAKNNMNGSAKAGTRNGGNNAVKAGVVSQASNTGVSSSTPVGTSRRSSDRPASILNKTMNSKSRRVLDKVWAALKRKRNANRDTLIAYYRPPLEAEAKPQASPLKSSDPPVSAEDGSEQQEFSKMRFSTPPKTNGRDIPSNRSSPVLDLGSKSFPVSNRRSSSVSINSTSSAVPTETPVRRGGQQTFSKPHKPTIGESTPSQQPSQPSVASLRSQNSGLSSHNSIISNDSQTPQGSPQQTQTAFATAPSPSGISRPMSTYSEMSSFSQISVSSVDASQLLSDVQESPENSKQANSAQRWRSFANAGLAKKNSREAIATSNLSTPPRVTSMRQRVRMLSLKERIPQKIDESEGEGDEE